MHRLKRRFVNPFSSLYDRNGIADEGLRRDLTLFTTSAAVGSIFYSVTGGTPYTDFAVKLGADDFHFSVLFAVPAAFAVLQLVASWLLEKTRKRKLIFLASGIVSRATWLLVALTPVFIPMDKPMLRLWTVIALISFSSLAGMFMNVTFFSWLGDIVPIGIRGRYLGLRYSITARDGPGLGAFGEPCARRTAGINGVRHRVRHTVALWRGGRHAVHLGTRPADGSAGARTVHGNRWRTQ